VGVSVPPGYTALAVGTRRALVRDDLVPRLGPWLLATPLAAPPGAVPLDGGRGAAYRLELGSGPAVVVRLGRRGGAIARVVREWYVGARPRPWRELAVSLAARGRGAPVPEVVAACVHGWGAYRSAVVTSELAGVAPVVAALRAAGSGSARASLAAAAGRAVARLHAAGVAHPDLNLGNIVVGPAEAAIVDLDRARIGRGALAPWRRHRSLRRLRRSAGKVDPTGALVDADVRARFHEAYAHALEAACGS
jgi:3-deoxy-D-manno-octulosonic acid kinase